MRGNGRQICRHCGEVQQSYTDPLLLDCYPKINNFFFGTSETQMVNVNASCPPETADLRLNLLSFFFHANFLSVGYRYWDISQMNRDKLETFPDKKKFLYL